ncbi:HET-domain-containing protein [Corynespora cassiicola Philippines]|uniref:HET-domain-containing protein n=1 Tax=Corynespora cassiicola Philippines TaxID=1448308 RepID=A0A2T2NHF1_CORCC|nr:HET-domain-containing protein [Corynespora cassiicola Philippines]
MDHVKEHIVDGNAKPFEYSLLTEDYSVRLLRVLPGSGTDQICCELFPTSIREASGKYIAGSYTWGPSFPTATITLNGSSFDIRENLHDFLKVCRHSDDAVLIWVDAICIDQSNLVERTRQVGLMVEIYGQAAAVAIWLGPSSETLDYAMGIIEKLGADASIHLDSQHAHSVFAPGEHEAEKTVEVAAFFNLPWWFRVWTVQEYALAKRRVFYCGTKKIEGKVIDDYATNVHSHHSDCCSQIMISQRIGYMAVTMDDSVRNIETLRAYDSNADINFLHTLGRFEFRLATDPRDRLYDFLGIARVHGHQFMDAIYDCTPQQACATLVQKWVDAHATLDFLEHIADYPSFPTQSFVPDWTDRRPWDHNRWDCDHRLRNLRAYDASGGRPTDFVIDSQGSAHCAGIIVDTVKSTTEAIYHQFWDLVLEARALSGFEDRPDEAYEPTGQSIHDAFALTMTAGLRYKDHNHQDGELVVRDAVDEYLLDWMEWIEGAHALCVAGGTAQQQLDVYSVHKIFRSVVYGRSFVVTEKGYFGFAPNSCREGDVVAVLFGSKSPCILRPSESTKDFGTSEDDLECRLLGTAYIHGAMHGECLRTDESKEDVSAVHFRII